MNKLKLCCYMVIWLLLFYQRMTIRTILYKYLSFSILIIILIDIIFKCIKIVLNSNSREDDTQKIDKLCNMIDDVDNKLNVSHIIIGDYNSRFEKDSNYKLLNINSGNNFLIPLSKAYEEKKNLIILIETNGGDIASTDIIFRSLLDYPYGVTIYVINYAFSAGTFITLAAKDIYLSPWSLLGPTDPQITHYPDTKNYTMPSDCYIEMINNNKNNKINEKIYMTSINAKKYYNENIDYITESLSKQGYHLKTINNVIAELCSGKHSHGRPFNSRMLKEIGLVINNDIDQYIYDLNKYAKNFMDSY